MHVNNTGQHTIGTAVSLPCLFLSFFRQLEAFGKSHLKNSFHFPRRRMKELQNKSKSTQHSMKLSKMPEILLQSFIEIMTNAFLSCVALIEFCTLRGLPGPFNSLLIGSHCAGDYIFSTFSSVRDLKSD